MAIMVRMLHGLGADGPQADSDPMPGDSTGPDLSNMSSSSSNPITDFLSFLTSKGIQTRPPTLRPGQMPMAPGSSDGIPAWMWAGGGLLLIGLGYFALRK